MEKECEISFGVSYVDEPEKIEAFREAVSVRTGLPLDEIADRPMHDLIRYYFEAEMPDLFREHGIRIDDSGSQEIEPSPAPGPR